MDYIEIINELFASDLTSYQIAKDNGLSPQFIDNYRVGNSKIENMRLGKAQTLVDYWKNLNKNNPTIQEGQ
ncbi:XRE family transcriptional regulator [Aerococcaceae bacterium DSM 111022]|nr:XRE family transcriptional regulator [Aerococcaceae bacterium DSM 111022]